MDDTAAFSVHINTFPSDTSCMPKKTVAIQGERGAFSEVAAQDFLGQKLTPVLCDSFDSLFDRVESGSCGCGVIPIENSLIGSIHRNYDLLLERSLKVIGETYLRINHALIAPPGITVAKIRSVFSHPAALDQCLHFFRKHPKIKAVPFYDTAGAVKMLSEEMPPDAAAIASPLTAAIYNMNILRKSLEDEKSNYTRFLLISKKEKSFSGTPKTSIVFSMKNEPGILYKVLSVFALRDIDLTKIESRPLRKKAWQYHFYLDFNGSVKDEKVKNALRHLTEVTNFIKILGSYPLKNQPT